MNLTQDQVAADRESTPFATQQLFSVKARQKAIGNEVPRETLRSFRETPGGSQPSEVILEAGALDQAAFPDQFNELATGLRRHGTVHSRAIRQPTASSPVSVPVLDPNFSASIPSRCSMLT